MKYKVLVEEILARVIEIDSEQYDFVKCYEHAEDLVVQAISSGDIVLNADDFADRKYTEIK